MASAQVLCSSRAAQCFALDSSSLAAAIYVRAAYVGSRTDHVHVESSWQPDVYAAPGRFSHGAGAPPSPFDSRVVAVLSMA